MIALFSDFGLKNPYVGQMHAAISALAPSVPIIDLFHHAPAFDTKRSAYLLKALIKHLPPECIVIGVVDPGVGSQRKPIAVACGKRWFIGPDNGLFSRLLDDKENSAIYEIIHAPSKPSNTFHGRDVFAPAAARVAQGKLETLLSATELEQTITRDFALLWPRNLAEIIFIDDFGNATTGIKGSALKRKHQLRVNYSILPYKRSFSSAQIGQPFWTVNSMGLVEIAANQRNAARMLSLSIGDVIELL